MQNLKKAQFQFQNKELQKDFKHNKLKERAFAKRHNIIVFGLVDNNSQEEDVKEAEVFFENKMGLPGLEIHVTYRLGTYRQESLQWLLNL